MKSMSAVLMESVIALLIVVCIGVIGPPLVFVTYVLVSDFRGSNVRKIDGSSRYATKLEVSQILQRCGVEKIEVVRAGLFFYNGWAWNYYEEPNIRWKRWCFTNELRRMNATAEAYDAMG